jgi:ubiquinone/menaquinone biosynthesis C-methylase UbiE
MVVTSSSTSNRTSQLVNGILAIKPLFNLAKRQARSMMIKRAESIGVYWREEVKQLRSRNTEVEFSPAWEMERAQIQKAHLNYPDYYLRSFHAYEQGNLSWDAAMEVEVAAHAVHARIWPDAGAQGDAMLRQSYHTLLQQHIPQPPQDILDIGCSVGMSTFALQEIYPQARVTGIDLSPYFLTIAQYRSQQRERLAPSNQSAQSKSRTTNSPTWIHAAAEETGLPDASFDLVSAHLLFHELPQSAAIEVLHEARRLLRPGGHFALMDMNPQSEVYARMPPYILTLLKSTEPYLDEYFSLDLESALSEAGFHSPIVISNSSRHRTAIAQAR